MKNNGFRYKMTHIGDIVVDNVINGFRATKGIAITYDMYGLRRKRKKALLNIGIRAYEIKNTTPEQQLFNDTDINDHFQKLNKIEEEIELKTRERQEHLYPEI